MFVFFFDGTGVFLMRWEKKIKVDVEEKYFLLADFVDVFIIFTIILLQFRPLQFLPQKNSLLKMFS